MKLSFTLAAAAVALVTVGGVAAHAQRGQRDPLMRIWTGVYAPAQAERGKAAFASACAQCHSADLAGGSGPQLAGPKFMTKWELESLNRMFRTIKDNMPRNMPGTLEDATVADLIAFILQSNGFPPAGGAAGLPADDEALDGIVFVPQSGPTKLPNFALVQVSGCLVEERDRTWTLAQASEPAAAKDVAPTEADIKASASRAPGTGRFKLVSAMPFAPDRHVGETVYLKGIINRNPSVPLLNVTALAPTGSRCAN